MNLPALLSTAVLGGSGVGMLLAGRRLAPRLSARIALGIVLLAGLPFLLLRGPSDLPGLVAGATFSRLDALGRVFGLLGGVLAVGLLVWMALGAQEEEARAAPWLLLFQGVFLHLLSTGDLLVLYASWEALILLTYLFLSQWREGLPTPGIAEWFLGAQHLAGYPMLAALLLIWQHAGTLGWQSVAIGDVPPQALSLLLGTMWLRMAQVPFQGWLLSTARAPSPAQTLLQSGWLMLVGAYTWLRVLSRVAAPPPQEAALLVGGLSFLLGAILAMRQETGPQVLAGDTVARLGLLWMALGLGGAWGIAASLFLLVELVAGKVLFHVAFSDSGELDGSSRRALYALAMWGAAGFPPSAGLVGRWLLGLGLLQAGRLPYLALVLLATPFFLAALWRGWTLIADLGEGTGMPPGRCIGIALALSVPLSGLLASFLWRGLFERVTRATASTSALLVRRSLEGLKPSVWVFLASLLFLGFGAVWSGCLRRWERRVPEPAGAGLLREPLPVLNRDTAWLAWIAQPVGLYRAFARLGNAFGTGVERAMRFLERHTTYFLLFVLIAAGATVIALTR
ncbi:MAG: proton-conducting transporter membrane subunit [Chloroflexia bacterium]